MFQSVLRRLRDRQAAEFEGVGAAEGGFTLIELMVVLLIIAILLAIAIPTFLGVTSSANDRATQSNLTNGLTEAASQYQAANQSYLGVSALLVASAPEFTWTGATGCLTSTPNCISVAPYDVATSADQQGVVLAAMSKTGTCWYIAQLATAPAVVAGTGFNPVALGAPPVAGNELNQAGAALLTTAGAYYAKKVGATTAQCNATYPSATAAPDSATGFKWGSSFSNAGVD